MIGANIGAILVVTGALTVLVGVGMFIPRQLLDFLLAEKTSDATVILIARHWTLLLALVGGLLIYAAYHPGIRVPVMIVGAAEKLTFGVLVITSPLRRRLLIMLVVCADAIMALLYVLFLTQQQS
ncbi:MAG: hypothetical protein WA431_06015 [Candidatus Cybelea sp.]